MCASRVESSTTLLNQEIVMGKGDNSKKNDKKNKKVKKDATKPATKSGDKNR
jgi:hypothetical protein